MSYYLYVPISTDNQLLVFSMDAGSGQLERKHQITLSKSGYTVAADPKRQYLYVGLRDGDDHAIGSYAIDPATGALTSIGEVPVTAMPCYLSADHTGRFLLAAYYVGGMATVHAIGGDGALQDPAVDTYETERFAHYIATDPSNRYAFVPHVESANSIYQFLFDADTGKLSPNPATPILACGSGRRAAPSSIPPQPRRGVRRQRARLQCHCVPLRHKSRHAASGARPYRPCPTKIFPAAKPTATPSSTSTLLASRSTPPTEGTTASRCSPLIQPPA